MIRLALSQINVTVGDLAGNREKILDHVHRARDLGAHVVVFPELAIPGYPPEDLLFKPRFIQSNLDVLNELVRATAGYCCDFRFCGSPRRYLQCRSGCLRWSLNRCLSQDLPAQLRRL